MRVRIGVTDWDWYTFLSGTGATEVNFWQPTGRPRVQLPLGSPFLFKSKFDRGNRIVGGGFFNGWVSLPLMRAWEIFGTGNGTSSFRELEQLILKYRERHSARGVAGALGPEIGCVMLRDVRFLTPDESLAAPPDWPKQAVQGKNYDLSNPENSYLEVVLARD